MTDNNQNPKRPRVSPDTYELIEQIADEESQSIRNTIDQMARAYAEGMSKTTESNNKMLRDIHDALGLDGSGVSEAQLTDALEEDTNETEPVATDGAAAGVTDYNALTPGHNLEIDYTSENWAKLQDNGVIKQGPKQVVPLVEGFINDMYEELPDTVSEALLRTRLEEFGLTGNSVRNYLYDYGDKYDAWYPAAPNDPDFKSGKVYRAIIEKKAVARNNQQEAGAQRELSVVKSELKNQHTTFASMFEDKTVRVDGEEVSVWNDQDNMHLSFEAAEEDARDRAQRLIQAMDEHGGKIRYRLALGYTLDYCVDKDYITDERAEEIRAMCEENDAVIPYSNELLYE